MRRIARAAAIALALLALLPALVMAHPLGNFTINHFAALTVRNGQIGLDVVIDRAEIPTFQERQKIDTDGDGQVSPAEQEQARQTACPVLAVDLALTADGTPLALDTIAAGVSFPPGAGGLPTMRLVCEFVATVPATVGANAPVTYADNSFAERIGWREIVYTGDLAGVSKRLTSYPQDLLTQPLNVASVQVPLSSIGPSAAVGWLPPDAQPLTSATATGRSSAIADAPAAAVPGGIGGELSAMIDAKDLSPLVVLVSLLIAMGLGAAHAVSPGHGKTIMAAYLVGTKGTARHAIALGMTVTVSHTLGVLALAAVTLAASAAIPPERLYPVLGVGSGVTVVLIGAWLLFTRLRTIRNDRRHAAAHAHGNEHAHSHDHGHDHGHSHAPDSGKPLSWRGLFALGLSGGLMPSAAALILLLGSISAGRVAYGLLLVVGFGLGMALVLGGVGLTLVYAARLVNRLPNRQRFAGSAGLLQMGTAAVVIVLGVVLTGQALTQVL